MAIKDTCKFGAFYDGGTFSGTNAALQRVQSWEARYGIRMDIINNFRKAGYGSISGSSGHVPTALASMQSTGIQGRSHLMSWEWAAGDTARIEPFRPYDIVYTTQHDDYINEMALALAQWGETVYIRLNHEFNGNWYGWAMDPCCYRDHWQKIVDMFRAQGATNVKWVWCPNGGDAPSAWNKMESYWPGASYVDKLAFDQYNAYSGWRSFTEMMAGPYSRVKGLPGAYTKKVWICETGTPEASDVSGAVSAGYTKSQWYTDMFNATGFDDIEYIIMFDTQGGYNWKLDTTTTSRDTFKSLAMAATLTSAPPTV